MYGYQQESFGRGGSEYGYSARDVGSPANGWLAFSMLLIFFSGLWNVFQGGIAFFRAAFFTGAPVFGDLTFWAVVWIAVGLLQMGAAIALVNQSTWARWLAVGLVVGNMMVNMVSIVIYPWWSLFAMATGLIVLYGLLVHWHDEDF